MTQPTYSHTVGNKPIWVFDNLCSQDEATSIFKGLEISAFKHNEVARPDTAQFKHWAVGLSDAQITSLPVYQRAMEQISETTGKKYRAYRGYVNYASYGDMLFTHTDCLPEADELTVLVYLCPEWDIEWGGETLFYNEHDDCVFASTPKPGRTVIFHGAIKHVGRPPNRICYTPRYTLAFKLEPIT
jgi:Rps23 Pro-64 3,4-dihydroxylase Tpa1-like proline 4-hydroxylase